MYKSRPSLFQETQNPYHYTLAHYQYSISTNKVIHSVFIIQIKFYNMFKTSLVLLALSLTTLTLSSVEEGLQKRWADPWIGSYELSDTNCTKAQVGYRPEWGPFDSTKQFTPGTPRIGKWILSLSLP